jgi:hypothetical protein
LQEFYFIETFPVDRNGIKNIILKEFPPRVEDKALVAGVG